MKEPRRPYLSREILTLQFSTYANGDTYPVSMVCVRHNDGDMEWLTSFLSGLQIADDLKPLPPLTLQARVRLHERVTAAAVPRYGVPVHIRLSEARGTLVNLQMFKAGSLVEVLWDGTETPVTLSKTVLVVVE